MKNGIAKGACIALCIMFSAPLAMAGDARDPVPGPAPSVGDSWTYQYTDVWKGAKGNTNRTEITSIDDAGIHADIKRAASGALLTQQLFTTEMNPVNRGSMHFGPSFTRYAFPLTPGKEWTNDVIGDNEKLGKHWRYHIKGKVVDWEKIRVPAGEFDAIKIVVEATYRGEETGSNGGGGQLTETVWFVPEVNNFVKLDYRDTDWQGRIYNRDSWELMSFVRKPAHAAASR
jgi:hypothetical protein